MKTTNMNALVAKLVTGFVTLVAISSCSTVWDQKPPLRATDGSRIVTTAFFNQYRRDSLRIDRTQSDGTKTYYVIEKLPGAFHHYTVRRATKKSVTIRLFDSTGRTIDDVEIACSEFKKRPIED